MRLDKYLAKALNVTRSQALIYINDGKIKVNNSIIKRKDFVINEDIDIVYLENEKIVYRAFVYIMLNKPSGVVSAVKDNIFQTVVDIIKERKDIFPVGRLDKDTEGLLLLTNDGKLTHKLTGPKFHVEKKYFVITKEKIEKEVIEIFSKGLEIRNGSGNLFVTKPAKLELINDTSCYVTINEGKYHQIKNMFLKINNEVKYLKRISMGNLTLDINLKPGEYRYLNDEEIIEIKNQFLD